LPDDPRASTAKSHQSFGGYFQMTFRARYLQQLERLSLDEATCPYAGLAIGGLAAENALLSHLQQLAPGATWRDVFPDMPAHWDLHQPDSWTYPERALGSFDYPNPPRGSAVFASVHPRGEVAAGTAALERVTALGIPIFGAGMVLDRGDPHLYVVLPLGAPNEHVEQLAEFLSQQPGIGNAYPERFENGPPDGD
jgi:hypothetical protein